MLIAMVAVREASGARSLSHESPSLDRGFLGSFGANSLGFRLASVHPYIGHRRAECPLRNLEDGRCILLRIKPAGLVVLGISQTATLRRPERRVRDTRGRVEAWSGSEPVRGRTAPTFRKTRKGTKQAQRVAMPAAAGGRNHRAGRKGWTIAGAAVQGVAETRSQHAATSLRRVPERGDRAGPLSESPRAAATQSARRNQAGSVVRRVWAAV
jgi:hypothetical protein